jgi:hypothetical protein
MKAKELTFGIEIETTVPNSTVSRERLCIGNYHRGVQVPYLPENWNAERDGSIQAGDFDRQACEIVSPVLRGAEGLAQVAEVLRTLEAQGHKVNPSCGVHVHIGWKRDWPADALARLIMMVSYCEKGLYAVTGTKARERGRYCGGIRKYGNAKKAKPVLDNNRYHALNLTHLADRYDRLETVEFRVFSGSLNVVKILGWIQLCLGLVEKALNSKRGVKWNPKENVVDGCGWKKGGPGRTEAERMLYFVGWTTASDALKVGGIWGWISSSDVTMDEAKAELRRLADKYDTEV